MNRKDFYQIYEEWLRNVAMDAHWFSHRLDEIIDGDDVDLVIYKALDKIGASVEQARPKAEYLLAKVSPGIRIGESMSDEPLPVPTITELPAKLRELRKFNKWKLADVAQMTGLSLSFLSDIERGRVSPSFETLQKLADVYCVPITLQIAPIVGAPEGGCMSTYWGYRCVDCNHDSDEWLNHGDDVLAEFYHAWRLLSPVKDKLSNVSVSVRDGGWPSGDMSEFMETHGAHHVVLHNEYGEIKDIPPLVNGELSAS